MATKRRDSVKLGNPRRSPKRARVNADKKGAKIPALDRRFKRSQCYFDSQYGIWVKGPRPGQASKDTAAAKLSPTGLPLSDAA